MKRKLPTIIISTLALTLSTVPLVAISFSKSKIKNRLENNERELPSNYFEENFVKKALRLKKIAREFNSEFYLFSNQYASLSSRFSDLVKEQSIPELKENLNKYFLKNFVFENNDKNKSFANLIYELNWLIEKLSIRLSDLNFFLENNELSETSSNNQSEINKEIKEYLHDHNFQFVILKTDKAPITTLFKHIKIHLNSIAMSIKEHNALTKFFEEYKMAKNFIYDNINHINLDVNFQIIYDILNTKKLDLNFEYEEKNF
ncbi:hypothetical protein DA803_02515 [[Mycoplasma] phocae]|uniref:Uncharacterized protein n=1 Tax=[Mycoplasma] phocae TaxID=142651 RepID=A0A2Z5IQC7_9BACT|nr:hypothetical protein [[Mycoplasma] phocae]AXE60945.1 hypothetical protein DA803_02515 [[Mycoplasma] phocae]